MWRRLADRAVRRVFGDGFEGELAHRGIDRLGEELDRAVRRRPERLTTVRLAPGEQYTVIARPPATRRERRAARAERAAFARHRRASRPSGRQLTAARRLERAQRRAALARPGSRRAERARRAEVRHGERFDRLMVPTARQARAEADWAETASSLSDLRGASYERARLRRGRRRGARVRVYD